MTTNQKVEPPERNEVLEMLCKLRSISAHNPDRFETIDGLDNPDFSNGHRAALALEALDCFQVASCITEDLETGASDLVCGLLHLVHSQGFDPHFVLQNALGNFLFEAGGFSEVTAVPDFSRRPSIDR